MTLSSIPKNKTTQTYRDISNGPCTLTKVSMPAILAFNVRDPSIMRSRTLHN